MQLSGALRLSFPNEGASAVATLLYEKAPSTCDGIARRCPISGMSHHAIYSGSECVLILPELMKLAPENSTITVTRGDVAFTWMRAGSSYGVTADFAEICWFYDLDAQPRMSEGPVPVSIFAQILEPAEEFYMVCRRMRRDGVKPFTVEFIR